MLSPENIIASAIKAYNPSEFVLMVSGGHDSVTNAHKSARVLKQMRKPFLVYHGDTTIGIPETQEYVSKICDLYDWSLEIRRPPNEEDWYDNIVAKHGFPGPTRQSHQFMYRRLKERALRHFVTHELKKTAHARENVLLLSGVRQDESIIRMGYDHVMSKDGSRCWVNPIFYWTEDDCKAYMEKHGIPKNPVKERICISGECLCGAFAKREEFMEIKHAYPSVYKRLCDLQKIAEQNGHPWDWASGPIEWEKNNPKGQMNMFMCVGCEKKREEQGEKQ